MKPQAQPIHVYCYTLERRGQWIGVVRANGHETESRPFPSHKAAWDEAHRMLDRVKGVSRQKAS